MSDDKNIIIEEEDENRDGYVFTKVIRRRRKTPVPFVTPEKLEATITKQSSTTYKYQYPKNLAPALHNTNNNALVTTNNSYTAAFDFELFNEMNNDNIDNKNYLSNMATFHRMEDPKYHNINQIMITMATGLSMITQYGDDGHELAHMAEGIEEQKLRRGIPESDTTFTMLVKPNPLLPAGNNSNLTITLFEYKEEKYRLKMWNAAEHFVLDQIALIFPTLKVNQNRTGAWSAGMTVLFAFGEMKHRTSDTMEAKKE